MNTFPKSAPDKMLLTPSLHPNSGVYHYLKQEDETLHVSCRAGGAH